MCLAAWEASNNPERKWVCLIAPLVLALIVLLTQRWLTRRSMVSILPWRRVLLAKAELVITSYPWRTGVDAQVVQLKVGEKLVYCPVQVCADAEKEELMQRLRSTCKSCTERRVSGMPREVKRLIMLRVPVILALVAAYTYFTGGYVPISEVEAETAQYGTWGANGARYFARAWYRANEAVETANSLLMLAMERPEESSERERRPEWYAEMQAVDGFAEKRYTEAGRKRAVQLADTWYGRAAELGQEQAAVMQLYLRTCGVPPMEEYVDAEGILHRTCAAESLGDGLLRMAMEKPKGEHAYTAEQQATALELAADWYYRATQWGHFYDEVMLAYLDAMGVPVAMPEVTKLRIEQVFRILSGKGDLTFKELVALQLCYQYGLGTEKDEQEAAALLRTIRELREKKKRQQTAPEGEE